MSLFYHHNNTVLYTTLYMYYHCFMFQCMYNYKQHSICILHHIIGVSCHHCMHHQHYYGVSSVHHTCIIIRHHHKVYLSLFAAHICINTSKDTTVYLTVLHHCMYPQLYKAFIIIMCMECTSLLHTV